MKKSKIKNNTKNINLPKSLKKYIRKEKARIRREFLDIKEQKQKIKELMERLKKLEKRSILKMTV